MSDINKFLHDLRKRRRMTLREASEKSGLSYSYISALERGKHPTTLAPISPSPESLKGLSAAYNFDYQELMVMAGYIEDNKKENAYALPESVYDQIIKETEEKYNVILRDDPFVVEAMKNLIDSYAKSKQNR
ncbi:helix-turn-helix domain-containing protein [Cohnella sp. GCM10027633]|uniref:helix-turn-helix domain-containing protein n=1 Tax=unclassified Cohnella TaxID=2636738 RepID=UPI00363318E4